MHLRVASTAYQLLAGNDEMSLHLDETRCLLENALNCRSKANAVFPGALRGNEADGIRRANKLKTSQLIDHQLFRASLRSSFFFCATRLTPPEERNSRR